MPLTYFQPSQVDSSFNGYLRNRIINGAMMIDQRNAGASITPTSGQYLVDRFYYQATQASKVTAQQNAGGITPPTGFTKYQGIVSSSAYSLSAGDYFLMRQAIEGLNVSDLAWGTASAAPVTLSFLVRSTLTGTFGGALTNAAANRWYVFSYTINSANTWEYKTIVIPGDTTGTWATDNTAGIQLSWSLGTGTTYSGTAGAWGASVLLAPTGSVSLVSNNAATWNITGVQLEVGSVATPFERRMYPVELAMCQRYFSSVGGTNISEMANVGSNQAYTTTQTAGVLIFPVEMRAAPTFSVSAASDWYVTGAAYTATLATSITMQQTGRRTGQITSTIGSAALTAGNASSFQAANINARMNLSAEL